MPTAGYLHGGVWSKIIIHFESDMDILSLLGLILVSTNLLR